MTSGPGSAKPQQSSKPDAPRMADVSPEQSPEQKRRVLAHCLPPQALRSGEGLQQEAVLEQSRDTVGMLKQGHQSHRDLNLSKLALQSRRSAPREEISH